MSHSQSHLEDAVKNLIAFENHAETDGCPHCMGKHALAVIQYLEEESEQRDGASTEYAKAARQLKNELPKAYDGAYIIPERMKALQSVAREIRIGLMKELGIPEHRHAQLVKEAERHTHRTEEAIHAR